MTVRITDHAAEFFQSHADGIRAAESACPVAAICVETEDDELLNHADGNGRSRLDKKALICLCVAFSVLAILAGIGIVVAALVGG
jgi:hypothetical protein